MSKAVDLLESWVDTFESDIGQEGSADELQELAEVKEALEVLKNNDGVFMIQMFYGLDEGWQNVREDGMLFSSKQEALEEWFEDELMDGIDITTLSLPNDIRIVEIKEK
jgi:hypothetical protein